MTLPYENATSGERALGENHAWMPGPIPADRDARTAQ